MTMHSTPQDDDPSGMTDFEKNTTCGALEDLDESPPVDLDAVHNNERVDRRGPGEDPGFGDRAQPGCGDAMPGGSRPG